MTSGSVACFLIRKWDSPKSKEAGIEYNTTQSKIPITIHILKWTDTTCKWIFNLKILHRERHWRVSEDFTIHTKHNDYLWNYATKNIRDLCELHSLSWVSAPSGDSVDQGVVTWAYCMLSISSGQVPGLFFHHSPQRTLHVLTEVLDKLITGKEAFTE